MYKKSRASEKALLFYVDLKTELKSFIQVVHKVGNI